MQTIVLGTVTEAEADEIQALYNRKTALTELCLTLAERGIDETNHLYERLIQDMAATRQKMVAWWERVAKNYGWQYNSDDQWRIDFKDRVVTLIRK